MLRKAVLTAVLVGIGATGVASAASWNDSRRDGYDGRYERRDQGRRWQGSPRHYYPQRPAPRYFGYDRGRAVPQYGWREPYGRGYRYWHNHRYYYVEPGRPAMELRFVLPLR